MINTSLRFAVDHDGPIAAYAQIENQVYFMVAAGRLAPGDKLPSVRDMSDALNLNANTVTKAYRDLELLEIVHTRRGVGVTVTEDAPDRCTDKARNMAARHTRDAIAECMACGFSAAEVRALVSEVMKSGRLPYEST